MCEMRVTLLLPIILCFLLLGCTSKQEVNTYLEIEEVPGTRESSEIKEEVMIRTTDGLIVKDFDHSQRFNNDTVLALDNITFTVLNNGSKDLNCTIELHYSNQTTINKTIKYVGFLKPGDERRESVIFEMPLGKSDLSLQPVCD